MTDKKSFQMPVLPLVMTGIMIIWATFFPIIKFIVVDMDPLVLSFYRYFLGFIPLTPFFISEIRKQARRPSPGEVIIISLLGFIGISIFSVGLFYGIKLSTAINGALLTNPQPIFTELLVPILIAEALSRRKTAGILVGITGMILVVTNGNFRTVKTSAGIISWTGPSPGWTAVWSGLKLPPTLPRPKRRESNGP
ncbi:MAG: DMT family transporter [Spirochaetales bacterium]|nr:DMT family transporter [Spirochaetales bacterium]